MDYSRISKNGNYVYFWTLVDQIEPVFGFLSYEEHSKGICSTNMISNRSLRMREGPMGSGEEEIYNYDEDKWLVKPEGSIGNGQLKEVCRRFDSL